MNNALLNIPLSELLLLWGELVEAWHGVNGFGGDTAEIYAYRLHRHLPALGGSYGTLTKDAHECAARQAASALLGLLDIFCDHYGCEAEIDGLSRQRWMRKVQDGQIVFDHRVHVRVINDV